jgi:hypothetical protein
MEKIHRSALLLTAVLTLTACAGPAGTSQASDPAPGEAIAVDTHTDARKAATASYEQFIGTARFASNASYEQNGYQVESGNLTLNGNLSGMLVSVHSPDGSILAVVDEPEVPGKSGTWRVTAGGQSSFIPSLPADYRRPDEVSGAPIVASLQPKVGDDGTTIDLLVGYSRAAANRMGDPIAYALLQAETVNLTMRNSGLAHVVLRVSGVQIVDEDFKVTPGTLARIDNIVRRYYGFDSDARVAFADDPGSAVPGLARPANESHAMVAGVDWPTSLRHLMGHIAGGGHCNDGSDASKDDYRFGYFNGKNGTVMCGNDTPYYSNPAVLDEHGLPRGDVRTGDMARLWEERAWGIANRELSLSASRLMLVSVDGDTSAAMTVPTLIGAYAGFVINPQFAGSTQGPRELADDGQSYTRLTGMMYDKFIRPQSVVFRAQRITKCATRSMQYYIRCVPNPSNVVLKVSFLQEDNPKLVGGMLNGVLHLRAKDYYTADWQKDISVLVSINRLPKTVLSLANPSSGGAASTVAQVKGGRYLSMIATNPSEGPVELVASAEQDFSFITPKLIDAAGAEHVVRLRAQRILTRCKSRAINVRDTCQSADLDLGISYLSEDNTDLPAGVFQGNVQLSAINYTDSERIPVTLNLKIHK